MVFATLVSMCNGLLDLRSLVCVNFFLIRKSIFFPPAISAMVSVLPLCPDDGELEGVEIAMVWCGELITRYMYVKKDNMSCKNIM